MRSLGWIVYGLVLCLAAFSACLLCSHSARITDRDASIIPLLSKLDARCATSLGLAYKCHLRSTGPAPSHDRPLSLDVSAIVQKPNLLNMEIYGSGKLLSKIIAGPKTTTIYDPSTSKSATFPTPANYRSLWLKVDYSGYQPSMLYFLEAGDTVVRYVDPNGFDPSGTYDTRSSTLNRTVTSVALNGKPAVEIRDSFFGEGSSVIKDLFLDPKSGSPVREHVDAADKGSSLGGFDIDYSEFRLLSSPPPAITFSR